MINTNAKTALCRLLRLGLVPKRLQSVFEEEGIIVFDEGVCGRLVTKMSTVQVNDIAVVQNGFAASSL